jgi:phage terminase large subunit GpA-like protein
MKPPEEMTVSEWADRYGVVVTGTGRTQKWKTREPQRAILDAFDNDQIHEISCYKSSRFGWTSILSMAMGYFIHQDPSPIVIVQPRDKDVQEWSKETVQPVIDQIPELSNLVVKRKPGVAGNSNDYKEYPGGPLRLRASNSPDGFRRYSARVAMLDEVDGYPLNVGVDGDLVSLIYSRVQDAWNMVIALGSTPTEADISRIKRAVDESSLGYPFLTCPHCGDHHIRKFSIPKKPITIRGVEQPISHIVYSNNDPSTAVYVCPACGSEITHKYHNAMLAGCFWIGEHWEYVDREYKFLPGFAGKIGFHPWAGYVISPNTTPQKLVERFLSDKKRPETLKAFVNTVLAEVWEEKGESLDPDELIKRCEKYDAEVPKGVLFLSIGVDVQGDRLELEVVGWGVGEESWSIDYVILSGDPLGDDVWGDLTDEINRKYKNAEGIEFSVEAVGIDHGHYSQRVNAYVSKQRKAYIFACKGVGGERQIIETTAQRKRRLSKARKTKAKPEIVGVDQAKKTLYHRLQMVRDVGPGYCHFPEGRDLEYFSQLAAEKRRVVYHHGKARYEWDQIRARNEALDCRNYAYASMLIVNPDFEKLSKTGGRKTVRKVVRKNKSSNSGFGGKDWSF